MYHKYQKYKQKYLYNKHILTTSELTDIKQARSIYTNYSTIEQRKQKLIDLYNSINFVNKIYLIGFGAIGKSLLYILLKILVVDKKNITIFESDKTKTSFDPDIKLTYIKFTKDNYKELLKDVSKNDIIIDCAYEIGTADIMEICNNRGAKHINSCIQEWTGERTLSDKHAGVISKNNELKNKDKFNYSCLVSMGCNPGNVSLWAKIGLHKIAKEKGIKYNDMSFGELAHKLGIQTIHISERDTQTTPKVKNINEYCNTWAGDGISFIEEAFNACELSMGTHEDVYDNITASDVNTLTNLPNIIGTSGTMINGYLTLDKKGANVFAQSYVPYYGRYIGNIICHDEAYTISNSLTLHENNKIKYRPSVYYVYHPVNEAFMSIHEVKERGKIQDNCRLLTDDITSGNDILGLTFYLEDKSVYWIGSLLDINESRIIFNGECNSFINATICQVVGGYLSGILYLIKQKDYSGLIFPDDLPHIECMKIILPFLGDFIFTKCKFNLDNWTLKSFIIP